MPDPDIENCRIIFSWFEADVILYGHVHKTSINRDDHRLYANFGSLGCPGKDGNIARAGILSVNDKSVSTEQVIVTYDLDKVINDINCLAYRASGEI